MRFFGYWKIASEKKVNEINVQKGGGEFFDVEKITLGHYLKNNIEHYARKKKCYDNQQKHIYREKNDVCWIITFYFLKGHGHDLGQFLFCHFLLFTML